MSVSAQIRIRRDTAANFTSANPTLALGEIAFETDTRNFKVGDGVTAWTALAYTTPYRGNAIAPASNVTIGPSAGIAISSATNNVLIGNGAGDTITGSNGSVAIGQDALGAQVDGALTINNTVAGTLSTVAGSPHTGVQLVKDSGVGVMTVYPIVTLTVAAGGDVTAVQVTSPGSGATVPTGIVFKTNDARIDPAWRGTLAEVPVNTAIGKDALKATTTGRLNTAFGPSALMNNTTGNLNEAFGVSTLQSNTTGNNNNAFGNRALQNLTDGVNNVAVGTLCLFSLASGSNNNVAIGNSAGRNRGSGSDTHTQSNNSIFVGADTRPAGNSQSNQIVIGHSAIGNGSNTTTLGNSSTTGTFIPAGNLTLSNGNLILGTSGDGISFAATGDAANVPARNAGGGITGTATAPNDGDTVTVGASVYTFKTTLTPANGEVLIGADSQASLTNLANAINGTGGTPGTDYQVAGANASATAAYSFVSNVPYVSLRAITAGSAGNSIALSETSAQLSVGAAFAGGADAVTNPIGELLNDYEEGTWDPVLAPTTGSFDMVTMRVHEARYIKVGRMVTVFGAFSANVANTTGSGLIRITGLPYAAVSTVAAGTAVGTRYTGAANTQNWAGTRPNAVMLNSGDTVLRLANQGTDNYTDTTTASLDQRPFGNRQYTVFTISYPAA